MARTIGIFWLGVARAWRGHGAGVTREFPVPPGDAPGWPHHKPVSRCCFVCYGGLGWGREEECEEEGGDGMGGEVEPFPIFLVRWGLSVKPCGGRRQLRHGAKRWRLPCGP
eukprot:gene17645-biopygen8346